MLLNNAAQLLGAFTALASASVIPERRAVTSSYLPNVHSAITTLQTFYNNPYQGDWTSGWWNSANCLTLLADLRKSDSSSFLTGITDGPNGVFQHTLASQNRAPGGALSWDDYYDDELWWVLGLIATYDATNNRTYLIAANESFAAVTLNDQVSPCGGLYNAAATQTDPPRVPSSSIATLLYVDAAAQLANRMPLMKSHYTSLALTQWNWVEKNILIDGLIQGDSLTGSTCSNNHAFLTYLEGIGISAGVALYYATNNNTHLTQAETIASQTITAPSFGYPIPMVSNGIVTEYCDYDTSCNPDEAQFKGILIRGLQKLYATAPSAIGGTIPSFIQAQANSIWANSRGSNGILGMAWAGPWNNASNSDIALAQHSSALMALVYAYLV